MSLLRALPFPGRNLIAASLLSATAVACSGDVSSIASPSSSGPIAVPDSPPSALLAIGTYANPVAGASFYVDPYSNAKKTATAWRTTRPADAIQMDKVATQASAKWIGNWNTNVYADVYNATTTMTAAGKVPVFVAYNIPQRDCGGLSGGNLTAPTAYKTWITNFANGIGNRRAVVILEPDALAQMDCLPVSDWQLRFDLMKFAVQQFASKGNIAVYLDAGNPRWKSAQTIGSRLVNAGIQQATGFSINVSNFYTTSSNIAFGTQVSSYVGGRHFVIDTGRNGLGPTSDYQWCNPAGRALGDRPGTVTGNSLVDAFLWIKTPGESDGSCNGNPGAGTWMPEYALGLAQRG
ncbi:MAG: glycoside hydrolase family 6 protein [Gemmatimonadaceae bacterium]